MRFVNRVMASWKYFSVNPVLVCIDNVAKYYFDGTSQETFSWEKDFPNIAPPWPEAVFFMALPVSPVLAGFTYPEFAVLVLSTELGGVPSETLANALRYKFGPRIDPTIQHALSHAKWMSRVLIFNSAAGDTKVAETILFIDHAGRYLTPLSSENQAWEIDEKVWPRSQLGHLYHVVGPVLLALSFLHCKNTVVEDVVPDARLAKRTVERYGVPLNSYKVLNIQPMAEILAAAASGDESMVKRLHICRGHFKDYRQRGVFGKAKGLYWWGQHVRGDKALGVIAKDYAVKAPRVEL